MEQIAISKFKATCLAALEEVRKTREPLVVTKFGKPIAKIVPPEPPKPRKRKLGGMAKTIEIAGDIVSAPPEQPKPIEVRW
jgi:prevent-host-death family protein